jgi:hypothetical protein
MQRGEPSHYIYEYEIPTMKRTLVALLMLCTALTLCPNPAGAAVVIVTSGPGFYAPGYYRGPAGYRYYAHPYWHSRYWRGGRRYYR